MILQSHFIPPSSSKANFIDYHKYLSSKEWRNKKEHWIKLFGSKCFVGCGNIGTNLHHRHYKNLGTEPPHQLVLLCDSCHKIVHGYPENFTTNKREMKINLRRLLRLYRNRLGNLNQVLSDS